MIWIFLIRRPVKNRDKKAKLVVAATCIICTYPRCLLDCWDVSETSDIRFETGTTNAWSSTGTSLSGDKNAVGKGSMTDLVHKEEDATEVFADVSRFSHLTLVPHGQKFPAGNGALMHLHSL